MGRPKTPPIPTAEAPGPVFRSAAVARMAHMPVATLRIWEQRYGAVQPATAPSGHRLYAAADVQRVLLLRQLTERGHAIGSIASLSTAQLQQLAQGTDGSSATDAPTGARSVGPLRLAVVGPALALRLQREPVLRRLHQPPRLVSVFESLDEAARGVIGPKADVLLWQAPELQADVSLPDLRAAQAACQARRVAVLYRFAGTATTQALAATGAVVAREPAGDDALGSWLASIASSLASRDATNTASANITASTAMGVEGSAALAPRRFDDAALTAIAGLSPQLACECPRHVAELLMQLSSFETYSAGCMHRDAADAELHAYLHHVAGTARALFESALVRVARHEGLSLP